MIVKYSGQIGRVAVTFQWQKLKLEKWHHHKECRTVNQLRKSDE